MEEGRHVFQEGNAFTLEALLDENSHMIALLLDQGAEVCEAAMT